ncbi:beta-1,6-N-acetylglucosaminyltransferase [bacterium 19MO02SH05]|uniref:Peptide O-xylosyltransferase n=1 Tax=bacterium 19MO02SH05 TaxID=2920696 RepID=A0AAU6THW1_UNCXX
MKSLEKEELSSSLKLVFVVQCHKVTNTLEFLISKLNLVKNVTVFIHVDKKSNINDFIHYESDNVRLIKDRINVSWGGISQVLLYVNALKLIEFVDFDYVSFISGDDFLLRDIEVFRNFLNENKGKEFIGIQSVHSDFFESRYKFLHPSFMFERNLNYKNRIYRKIFSLVTKMGFLKNNRKSPHLNFYKGSNWFTISKYTSSLISLRLQSKKEILEYFSYSYCCDEIFFQSIIMNEPSIKYKVYKYEYSWMDDNAKSLRYIDWKSGPDFPRVFSRKNLLDINIPKIYFFCRKIDPSLSVKELSDLFDKINED